MAERDVPLQHKASERNFKTLAVERSRGSPPSRDWEELQRIGQGEHGTIYLQRHRVTNKFRAVKTLGPSFLREKGVIDHLRELRVLSITSERPDLFVLCSRGYSDSASDPFPLAIEFHRNGDLEEYLGDQGPLGDESAKRITKNLLEALDFLHGKEISHRDVKPENIIIASKHPLNVKLANFGISKFTKPSNDRIISLRLGTVAYIAPENFGIFGQNLGCTNSADIWALGCVVFKMFTLKTPFMERWSDEKIWTTISTKSGVVATSEPITTDMKLLLDFCKGKIPLPGDYLQSHASKQAMILLRRLLVADPRHRISAADALECSWMIDLLKASETGQIEVVRQLLQRGEKIDAGKAILLAAKNGHLEVVKLLIMVKTGINIQKTLQIAAENGHVDVTRLLLKAGRRNKCQRTLQLAVKNGHAKVVKLLLENGFDANPLYYGPMMLLEAAGNGHLEIVRELLRHGAEVNPAPGEPYEQTALQASAKNGHLKVVRLLLRAGADVNAKPGNLYGQTALQGALETGRFRVGKLLLENGADPNVWYHGPTTLTAAVGSGLYDWVKLLLENRAEANAKPGERQGKMPLQVAAEMGYMEIVKLLLHHGAKPNYRYYGPTALQLASANGHYETVKELLANGAEVNARPSGPLGRMAFQGAVEGGHLSVAELLLQEGADINGWYSGYTTLRSVAGGGNVKAVSFLLSHGVDIYAKPGKKSKKTPLQAAVRNGHLEVVKILLEGGHRVRGQHTLRLAAKSGKVEVVKFLLDKRIDDSSRHRGHAFEAAAAKGQLEVLQFFIANGFEARTEPWRRYGRRALDVAIEQDCREVRELLQANGFEPSRDPTS